MDQDKKKPHHRQCTIDDRLVIQHRLNELFSFNAIAKEIGKHRTTVSLEVRRNSVAVQKGAFGRPFNDCAHRRACDHRQLCEDKPDCLRKCSICALCNQVCPDYEKERCPRLSEPPYVCNGCPMYSLARDEKIIKGDENMGKKDGGAVAWLVHWVRR